MIFKGLYKKTQDKSAIILVVVLWILIILSMLAVGLGRRTNVDVMLARYAIGKTRAKYYAIAGLVYAVDLIRKDSKSDDFKRTDTLYDCGIALEEGKYPEDVLKKIPVGDGFFDIAYYPYYGGSKSLTKRYGIGDEDSKINLNAITRNNYKILEQLVVLLGFDDDTAQTIASSVVDWHDNDDAELNPPHGAEDNYYMGLSKPYQCKDAAFDSIYEILMVQGVTPEIFSKMEPYITVYPKTGHFKLNFDTASRTALRAYGRSVAGSQTNTGMEDAESLIAKMITYRSGDDGVPATSDDKTIEMNEMGLNAKEVVIFLLLTNGRSKVSDYLRVMVTGTDPGTSVSSTISAVIDRKRMAIVYWNRS